MKIANVSGFFGEFKGKVWFEGRGRGSSSKIAISRAVGDILKQTRGKRWHSCRLDVVVIEESPKDLDIKRLDKVRAST